MLLKILDILECPKCQAASRLWKLDGELTDDRITNGKVICPSGHEWNVTEEILRFDEENNNEPMTFLDHPLTGLPPREMVKEQERFDFLDAFEGIVKQLTFDGDEVVMVSGDPILFLKFLDPQDAYFVISHPDEGVLRQLQENAVRKRMYEKTAFVRASELGSLGKMTSIGVIDTNTDHSKQIRLEAGAPGDVKWKGEMVSLSYFEP